MILGNKADLYKQYIEESSLTEFRKNNVISKEVSALTNKGVDDAFREIIDHIMPSVKLAEK